MPTSGPLAPGWLAGLCADLPGARGHVDHALELARRCPPPHAPERERDLAVAFLAAALGETDLALDMNVDRPGEVPPRFLRAAGRGVELALRSRFHPPGDPAGGLALQPGQHAVLRRHLERVASGFLRHEQLREDSLERHRAFAERELVHLAEALSGCAQAAGPIDDATGPLRLRQLTRLGLRRPVWREARGAVLHPRPPDQLADATPERIRPFLLEQLHVALLAAPSPSPEAARWVDAYSAAAEVPPAVEAAARVAAAKREGPPHAWFDPDEEGFPEDGWISLADAWEWGVSDQLVERATAMVTENLDAIVTELKETGELTQLLAKATAGKTLTAEEKQKVRAQLADLAKAVPALAIFAAPGGLLLLPLLAKLLPFNMLPSAWDREKPPKNGG